MFGAYKTLIMQKSDIQLQIVTISKTIQYLQQKRYRHILSQLTNELQRLFDNLQSVEVVSGHLNYIGGQRSNLSLLK